MPVAMKAPTATSERGDSLARPQMPCPEVQPDPIAVPSPTMNPATGRIKPDAAGTVSYTHLTLPTS